jgi:hypothetical protein
VAAYHLGMNPSLSLVGALVLSVSLMGTAGAMAAETRWVPPSGVNLPWQWELDHPLNTSNPSDMGTGVRLPNGQPAPDPVVYDIDGFDNPASTVTTLHGIGAHVICYIEVGAAETYRADYSHFPKAVIGRTVPGYPAEKYIDIRSSAVVSIIEARISMCAGKGFDAVEPDIDESSPTVPTPASP